MTSPSENYTAFDQKKAIQDELMRGREVAALLGIRLQDTEVIPLVDQVIGSFSRTLCLLDTANSVIIGSPSSDGTRSENSSGKRRIDGMLERGACKKRIPPSSCIQVTSKTTNDGYRWRKYGQKEIKGFTHPRSYFYCYHKGDQGCKVIRQVQRRNDDTSLFVITYLGKHTCKPVAVPQNILPHSSLKEQSLISFGSRAYNNIVTQEAPLLSSSFPSGEVLSAPGSPWTEFSSFMPNFETYEGFMPGSQTVGSVSACVSDYGDLNVGAFEGSTSGTQTVGSVSDYGDAIPGLRSSLSCLDMDAFDFMDEVPIQKDYDEAMFNFDEDEFFKDGAGASFF